MENHQKISILYIDDEINNLNSFNAGFRRKYTIHTAKSAAEGMEIIQNNDLQIVIADQRMPEVTGVELLQQIKISHPEIIRILLTGYTDVKAIIDAINKGHIYRYINKPWDELELENAINNAYEIYTTRKSLQSKMVELQKLNDELNRFVYSTAHDLRAPLASILGILHLMDIENNKGEHQEYLKIIGDCAEKINLYIKKIIEYYKNLRFTEEKESIDFKKILEKSIQPLRLQNPEINFEIEINQPYAFVNDLFRIIIIIDNLLSNASKFMRSNELNKLVKVKVEVTESNAFLVIEDNGTGIQKEYLEKVFHMFFRTNNSADGLGIGLFIVKEALEKLDGTITVESVMGKGTCFKIEIPNLASTTI